MKKALKLAVQGLSFLLLLLPLLWCLGLWYYQPLSLFPGLLLPGLLCFRRWRKSRRLPSLHLWLWGLVGLNVITYHLIPPPAPGQWQKAWALAPEFEQQGDFLTIRNLRDFRYRTEADCDARYRTETYDLRTLCGVDFASCHWDGMTAVCHTMLSFNFTDGRHFVVSAETRLPEGVEQGAIPGLYKKFGIIYLFGTEEDIYGLRTNIRHEELSLYPLDINHKAARKLLQHFIGTAREAERTNRAYNTISDNCSTGLVRGFRVLLPDMPRRYDFLPLHNGSIAGLLIRHNAVQHLPGESEQQIRERCFAGYDLPLDNYSSALRKKSRDRGSALN